MRAGVVTAGLLVGVLAACSSSSETTVDARKLERDIRSELQRSNRVREVDCPDGVKLETGTTFECTATVEGTSQIIDVELTGDKGFDFALRS
jgi:uncharacterized lipoprotein